MTGPNPLVNLCQLTTATTGTGTITLGAASSGYRGTPALTNGTTYSYSIIDGTNYELGQGAYTSSGTTLARGPVQSSSANAAITLSGTAIVIVGDALAWDISAFKDAAAAPSSPTEGDRFFDNTSGINYTYITDANGSQWVETSAAGTPTNGVFSTMALGGATVGSNSLAVTGTTALSGAVTLGSTLTYSDGLTPDGELILAQSFSSASTVVFPSVPSKFKRFRLQVNDLIFSTGASLRMQVSQSGVFKSAGYAWGLTIITTAAGANANVNNSSDSAFQVTGAAIGAGTNPVVVTVEIGNLASSSLNKTISFNGTYPPSSGGGSAGIFGGGTYLNDTNACDGIQIYGSAGTITGTASLRGYL